MERSEVARVVNLVVPRQLTHIPTLHVLQGNLDGIPSMRQDGVRRDLAVSKLAKLAASRVEQTHLCNPERRIGSGRDGFNQFRCQ